MKERIIQAVVVVVAVVSAFLLHTHVYAQEGPEFGCKAVQQYFKTTQKSRDVRTRVDRLQAYRYIHQRLDTFVRRVERNNQPNAKNLRANTNRLHDATEDFRLNYETYDKAREAVASIKDCHKKTEEFTEKLQLAREARAVIAQDVALLRSIIATNITEQLQATQQQLTQQEEQI